MIRRLGLRILRWDGQGCGGYEAGRHDPFLSMFGAHQFVSSRIIGTLILFVYSLYCPPLRSVQVAAVKSKFIEAIQNYQRVEQQYQTRYKQRIERQFKIVKPDASPEEVRAVVNYDEGGVRIFSQAVTFFFSLPHPASSASAPSRDHTFRSL